MAGRAPRGSEDAGTLTLGLAADAPFRGWQTFPVAPLPYSDSGARIAFYVVLGIFVVLEQRIRLKSLLNRQGVRDDRGSLLVVIVAVGAGVAGGFVIASRVLNAR